MKAELITKGLVQLEGTKICRKPAGWKMENA